MLGSFGGAFTAIAVLYLLWYGYEVFVRDKGNPGGLGLAAAAIAVIQILNALKDLL